MPSALRGVSPSSAIVVLGLALTGWGIRIQAQSQGRPGCVVRSEGSRWLASTYRASHRYGEEGRGWLATFGGIGVVGDQVFLYDQGRPGVLRLSSTLSPKGEFGRRGSGPGEVERPYYITWVPPYLDFDFLGAAGSSVVIFDQVDFEVFTARGEFKHQVRIGGRFQPAGFGIRYVELLADGRLLYVNDSIDVAGPRRLEVWTLDPVEGLPSRELAWEVPLPWEGGEAGLHVLAREARPFWARRGMCQVASDGTSSFLWKYDEALDRLDTLPLPGWSVPEFGEDPEDRRRISFGGRRMGEADPEPVALIRWTDLAVDPDGHVWVRAWTPADRDRGGEHDAGVVAFVGSMESGGFRRVTLPAFPRAFGPPGVYYALEADPETDEHSLVRYEAWEE